MIRLTNDATRLFTQLNKKKWWFSHWTHNHLNNRTLHVKENKKKKYKDILILKVCENLEFIFNHNNAFKMLQAPMNFIELIYDTYQPRESLTDKCTSENVEDQLGERQPENKQNKH